MSKYSEQFKLKVVEQYLLGAGGTQTVGDMHGVPRAAVRRWIELYRVHGVDGLKKKFSHYSAEFKLSVLTHLWENELSYGQAAAVFNIRNSPVIGKWERQYRDGGIEALRTYPSRPVARQLIMPQARCKKAR
jgi:transposase